MKKLLIITAVSLLLLVGGVLAVYFGVMYVSYEIDIYERIVAYMIVPLWMFGAVPAYALVIEWLSTKSFAFGFWYGCGLFLPILIAPVLMVFYYIGAIEKLIKKN